jgi:hypothetical protein
MSMSGIPPNSIGSAIQGAEAQRRSSESQATEEARTAHAHNKQASRNEEMDSTVETTEADTRVNTDGGGLGSQGRFHAGEGEEAEQEEQEQQNPHSGITIDEQGRPHIDLEA